MARYVHDFEGMPADGSTPRGADPNYRGDVYRGMRTRSDAAQSSYAWYRRQHEDDLGGYGGFAGGYPPHRGGYDGGYDRDYGRGRLMGGGFGRRYGGDFASQATGYDRSFMRGSYVHGGYGRDYEERGSHPVDRDTQFRLRYANRGLSTSGYSEPWARWPQRGGR